MSDIAYDIAIVAVLMAVAVFALVAVLLLLT